MLGDALLALGTGWSPTSATDHSWPAVLAQSAVPLAFAVLLGYWIFGIIAQSVHRRTA